MKEVARQRMGGVTAGDNGKLYSEHSSCGLHICRALAQMETVCGRMDKEFKQMPHALQR